MPADTTQTTDLTEIQNSYQRPVGPHYHREYQEYLRSHGWEIISVGDGILRGLWRGPVENHPVYAPPPCPGLADPWPDPGVLVRVDKREKITEGRLSTIGALRYIIAAYILMLAGIIAPQELGFLESLAAAARYASNRVKEGRHV